MIMIILKMYFVEFGSRIPGSYDYTYVMASDPETALKLAKPMLETNRLFPDFLNKFGKFTVTEL